MAVIKDKEIEVLRKQIDALDKDILRLLEHRFDVVRDIARLKKKKNLPVRDVEREMEIIRNKCKLTHLRPDIVEKIYRAIIDCSSEIQGEKT